MMDSDLLQERFNKDIWTTIEGEPIPVKEMTDSHLMNSLKMINRKGDNCVYGYGAQWFPKLKEERIRREHASRLQ